MDDVLKKYVKLKERAEIAQEKAAKDKGALGEVKKQLKKEFGCSSIKEAKTKLAQLEKQNRQTEKKFNKAFTEFGDTWNEKLD